MYGAAASLIEALRSACRSDGEGGGYSDWDLIPTGMFKYGSGGVAGWGTICGILNGAAAVLAMAGYDSLIGQVIGWYTLQSFPLDTCEGFTAASGFEALADIDVPAHTVSDSPLCHISISKFCEAAGHHPQRRFTGRLELQAGPLQQDLCGYGGSGGPN